ncbi:MAG: hypothetical protein O3C40_00885 [Planctomycetota bacterium]|nr:hypothetical protein [Planctomycetota bacterium]
MTKKKKSSSSRQIARHGKPVSPLATVKVPKKLANDLQKMTNPGNRSLRR